MPGFSACLIDIYETALRVDLDAHVAALASRAGVCVEVLAEAVKPKANAVSNGQATIQSTLEEVLRGWGRDPAEARALADADLEILQDLAEVAPDTVPFLEHLRERGVRTAFVSNCADNTRPLLDALGLSGMVDELVLSCEVQTSKPDPVIYQTALERLGVTANETVFVDDQSAFCAAASALGIRAVTIDRSNGGGDVAALHELLTLF